MDTARKTGIDALKSASKKVVQNTAEASGDLIGQKQLTKLLHQVKQRVKKKKKKSKKYT